MYQDMECDFFGVCSRNRIYGLHGSIVPRHGVFFMWCLYICVCIRNRNYGLGYILPKNMECCFFGVCTRRRNHGLGYILHTWVLGLLGLSAKDPIDPPKRRQQQPAISGSKYGPLTGRYSLGVYINGI